jgi:hypothetical protein
MQQTASAIRFRIETSLADKIPGALTPQPKMVRPVVETGIEDLDHLLGGGFPVGAVSELTGAECSGRTSVALSLVARLTCTDKVCAWIDVSNSFDPISAASFGVNLKRLLWVRCGVMEADKTRTNQSFAVPETYFAPRSITKGLHGGGFGPHPRTEIKGLSKAVGDLLHSKPTTSSHSLSKHHLARSKETPEPNWTSLSENIRPLRRRKQFDAIEQGLRSADLIFQMGGFSAIVLDLAGIEPGFVARIELSMWHRYRLAAERTQSSLLLLTQHPCAKSSSELQLRLLPAKDTRAESTIFTGMQTRIEVVRQRFTQPANNVAPLRKPPQSAHSACWQNLTTWAVR